MRGMIALSESLLPAAADAFALKHLASGEQVTVPRGELAQRILRT